MVYLSRKTFMTIIVIMLGMFISFNGFTLDSHAEGSTSQNLRGPVTLNADWTYNNVDNDLEITFTDDVTFRNAITGISYGGHLLTANQYIISAGKITLMPRIADNAYLRVAGIGQLVVVANGYEDSTVTQHINAGMVKHLVISKQPVPGPMSGSVLSVQPMITLKDQYDNICSTGPSESATVTARAKAGTGTFKLEGRTSKDAVLGVVTFSNLSVSLLTVGSGSITFSATETVESTPFDIPLYASKTLTADEKNNNVDNPLEITFAEDINFQSAIQMVKYGGQLLTPNQYAISDGKLTLKPSVADNTYLREAGTKRIEIFAQGYNVSRVMQTIQAGAVKYLIVTTQPVPDVTSGKPLIIQPVVTLKDQYENICKDGPSASADVVASAYLGSGSYVLGGTTTQAATAGVVRYTDLTTSLLTMGTGSILFTSNGVVSSEPFTLPKFASKTLMPDTTDNNVDNEMVITFTDDGNFSSSITSISLGGHALAPSQYVVGVGKITLKPIENANDYLRVAGTYTVQVFADGYNESRLSQTIEAGKATSLSILRQPVVGLTSGSSFTTQPLIALKDRYGNICVNGPSSEDNVTVYAKPGSGTFDLNGVTSRVAHRGQVTFPGLTTTLIKIGDGAVEFASGNLSVMSEHFKLPLNASIQLEADTTDNTVDYNLEVLFEDDLSFRNAITAISFNGHILTPNQYTIRSGRIILKPNVDDNNYLKVATTGLLTITATNYNVSSVYQVIKPGKAVKLAIVQKAIFGNKNGSLVSQAPKISLQDQYGNTVSTDHSTVVYVSTSNNATWQLSGVQSVKVTNGVATFSGLKLTHKAGQLNGQLIFSASGLPEVIMVLSLTK